MGFSTRLHSESLIHPWPSWKVASLWCHPAQGLIKATKNLDDIRSHGGCHLTWSLRGQPRCWPPLPAVKTSPSCLWVVILPILFFLQPFSFFFTELKIVKFQAYPRSLCSTVSQGNLFHVHDFSSFLMTLHHFLRMKSAQSCLLSRSSTYPRARFPLTPHPHCVKNLACRLFLDSLFLRGSLPQLVASPSTSWGHFREIKVFPHLCDSSLTHPDNTGKATLNHWSSGNVSWIPGVTLSAYPDWHMLEGDNTIISCGKGVGKERYLSGCGVTVDHTLAVLVWRSSFGQVSTGRHRSWENKTV